MQNWNTTGNNYTQHDQATEPGFSPIHPITSPLPGNYLPPHPSRWRRFLHGTTIFCSMFVRKTNQMLGFALLLLILILLTRFLLHFFNVTTDVNLFTQGISLITNPLITPFDHLFPLVPYQGYSIDVTTLISMGIYGISTLIVQRFLKLLVTRPN